MVNSTLETTPLLKETSAGYELAFMGRRAESKNEFYRDLFPLFEESLKTYLETLSIGEELHVIVKDKEVHVLDSTTQNLTQLETEIAEKVQKLYAELLRTAEMETAASSAKGLIQLIYQGAVVADLSAALRNLVVFCAPKAGWSARWNFGVGLSDASYFSVVGLAVMAEAFPTMKEAVKRGDHAEIMTTVGQFFSGFFLTAVGISMIALRSKPVSAAAAFIFTSALALTFATLLFCVFAMMASVNKLALSVSFEKELREILSLEVAAEEISQLGGLGLNEKEQRKLLSQIEALNFDLSNLSASDEKRVQRIIDSHVPQKLSQALDFLERQIIPDFTELNAEKLTAMAPKFAIKAGDTALKALIERLASAREKLNCGDRTEAIELINIVLEGTHAVQVKEVIRLVICSATLALNIAIMPHEVLGASAVVGGAAVIGATLFVGNKAALALGFLGYFFLNMTWLLIDSDWVFNKLRKHVLTYQPILNVE